MDETTVTPATSSSSSTTAAAAAVNSSKTTTMPATPTNTVMLVIKSSNQQYDDHIIESDLQWTVKRLKMQISMVYPSKPAVADQKLIYSGQLLNDKLLLKDVIRNYKDVYTHNHIFHLVCSIKNPPPAPPPAKVRPALPTGINRVPVVAEGLRHRRGPDGRYVFATQPMAPQQQALNQQQQQQQQQQPQYPYFMNPQYIPQMYTASGTNAAQCPAQPNNVNNANNAMPFITSESFNMHAFATQQVAMYNWMQQVYAQYMEHCMRMNNNFADMPNTLLRTTEPLPPYASVYNAHMPLFGANVASTAAATAMQPQVAGVAEPQLNAATAVPAENEAAPEAAEQDQQRRFPNIVPDDAENNDWLDSFYSITRLAIFLTIMYFNSSPLRCLFVVIIATVIYLYHIGVIRVRIHERNNNNINRNNNADADQIRQGVQQVQQAQEAEQQQQQAQDNPPQPEVAGGDAAAPGEQDDADRNRPGVDAPTSATTDSGAAGTAPANDEENNSVSVIGFVRTFVVTFFTSLLPEAPAAL